LKSVQNKLANEFVNGAPEKVLANERQKADALARNY
jgi:hypothetical protein